MPTKITVIYENPEDAEAFGWRSRPSLRSPRRSQGLNPWTSKVWPKEDGTPTPAYRLLDLYFADCATASAAVNAPEAGELLSEVAAIATGGARIVFADIEPAVGPS